MRVLRSSGPGAFVLIIASCGGGVEVTDTGRRDSSGAGDGGMGGAAPSTGGAGGGSGGSQIPSPDAATGGEPPFIDPGCPERPPVQGRMDCDVFASVSSCAFGERCVPYVEYADDCGTEEFGTACVPAGSGVQGDDCVQEVCSAGFVCVTTGEGSQCARLCQIVDGAGDCPPGLLCQSLDVDGFQICF